MRSANNVGNAGPHVCQTFLNDVFTFLTEVGNAGRIVNTVFRVAQCALVHNAHPLLALKNSRKKIVRIYNVHGLLKKNSRRKYKN